MVGGGIVKTSEQVERLARTDVIAEWGSLTTAFSSGNGGRDYCAVYKTAGDQKILTCTYNSLGLPNPGIEYAEKHGPRLLTLYASLCKPLCVNVSGTGVEDSLELLKRAMKVGFNSITVNGACPNKKDQPILCDDPFAVDELFRRADKEIGTTDAAVFWKVSLGMRRPALEYNLARVAESRTFCGIITGNTVPNAFDFDAEGRTAILTDKHSLTRGGMGGPAVLPIALDHTEFAAKRLPKGKVVVGCGGIMTSDDAMKFFLAGASMVQIVSAYREAGERPSFISDLLDQLTSRSEPMLRNLYERHCRTTGPQ